MSTPPLSSHPPGDSATDLLLDAQAAVDVLLDLESAKASGVLEARTESLTALIYLKKGVPVFAEQGSPTHSIGRTLLRQGVLNDAQHRAIIEHMTSQIFESEQMRFGEVAVKLGFVTNEHVSAALHEQVRQRIMACIAWEGATFQLYRDDEAAAGVVRYPCPVRAMIGEAVALYFDEKRTEQTLRPFWSLCPRLVIDLDEARQDFDLKGTPRAVLSSLRGTSRVAALLRRAGDDRSAVARALVTLLLGRALAFEPKALPKATVKAAVERTSLITDLAPKTEFVTVIVTSPDPPPKGPRPAAATSPDPPPKAPQPGARTLPRHLLEAALQAQLRNAELHAEQLFREGKRLLAEPTALPRAAKVLRQAAKLAPNAVEYAIHADWAELIADSDEPRAAERRRSLSALVDRALGADSRFAFGHYVRGRLLHMEGQDEQALSEFRVAAELDPSDADAARFRQVLLKRRRGPR